MPGKRFAKFRFTTTVFFFNAVRLYFLFCLNSIFYNFANTIFQERKTLSKKMQVADKTVSRLEAKLAWKISEGEKYKIPSNYN